LGDSLCATRGTENAKSFSLSKAAASTTMASGSTEFPAAPFTSALHALEHLVGLFLGDRALGDCLCKGFSPKVLH
jgi:hypothetical protein